MLFNTNQQANEYIDVQRRAGRLFREPYTDNFTLWTRKRSTAALFVAAVKKLGGFTEVRQVVSARGVRCYMAEAALVSGYLDHLLDLADRYRQREPAGMVYICDLINEEHR